MSRMTHRPSYLRVFLTFARNSLVRDMTFRGNFLIETLSSMAWVFMNLGFYTLIFHYTPMLGAGTGWGKYQFFLFLATTLLVNSVVYAFFMRNAQEISELVRNGTLDFALLKPIDTQFLVSLQRVEWSSLANFAVGLGLLAYALTQVDYTPEPIQFLLYPFYVACGVAILYSLMVSLAVSAVWLGRNQTLYNFWFYITNFSRYPMEIYRGTFGDPIRWLFTFILPVLVAVNVPARLLVRPLEPRSPGDWLLPVFALVATAGSLAASRWVFKRALLSYRSASS
jgi:ABC-2 type transport system permease protein